MPRDISAELAEYRPTIQRWLDDAAAASITRIVTQNYITQSVDLSGYLTTTAGDLRYYQRTTIDALLASLTAQLHDPVTSPLSSINIGTAQEIDVDLTHGFDWTGSHSWYGDGRKVSITSGAVTIRGDDAGGWAEGFLFEDSEETGLGGFGAYGTGPAGLTRFYIGSAHNDYGIAVDAATQNVDIPADIAAGGLRWDNGLGALWLNDGAPDGSATLQVQSTNTTKKTLSLQQTAGQTGDLLAAVNSSDSDMLRITAGGGIESGTFVSGASGWQIDGPTGNAEFNDLTARGTWSAAVFAIDEWQATNGTHIITKSNASVYEDVLTSGTGDTFTLKVDNSAISPGWWFSVGDTLYMNALGYTADGGAAINARFFYDVQASVGDFTLKPMFVWMKVTDRGTVDTTNGYQSYTVDVEQGTDGTIRAASAVINYGQRTDDDDPGFLVLTASQNHAPYMAVRTMSNDTPWSHGWAEHVRVGKLNGISTILGSAIPASGDGVWGIAAGSDLSDSSAPHFVISDVGASFYKVATYWSAVENITSGVISPEGSFIFARDVSETDTGGIRFYSSSGSVIMGDPYGNRLKWDGATYELSINGGPLATDGKINDRAPGLILSSDHFGHWRGVARGWGTYFDSGGNMALRSTSEDAVADAGIKFDAFSGVFSGFNATGRQWWADAHDGAFYAGGGAVSMDEDGVSIEETTAILATGAVDRHSLDFGTSMQVYGYTTGDTFKNLILSADNSETSGWAEVTEKVSSGSGSQKYAQTELVSRNGDESWFQIEADTLTFEGDVIEIETDNQIGLAFGGTGNESTSAGSSSGKYLPVILNGVTYKIELFNNS